MTAAAVEDGLDPIHGGDVATIGTLIRGPEGLAVAEAVALGLPLFIVTNEIVVHSVVDSTTAMCLEADPHRVAVAGEVAAKKIGAYGRPIGLR